VLNNYRKGPIVLSSRFQPALNLYLIFRLKFKGNQNLFQQEESLQDRRKTQKEWVIPIQNEKALFLQCHMVVIAEI
jgi:hypothetical protein